LLERCDPLEAPAVRVARDLGVEVRDVVVRRVGERAGERGGVALEDVVDPATGQVVLVEGEDGGAPLVAASGHRARTQATAARGGASRVVRGGTAGRLGDVPRLVP